MKNIITHIEAVERWINILEKVRIRFPRHAEYIGNNLVLLGSKKRKFKIIYKGNIEAIADILELALFPNVNSKNNIL